MSVRPAVAGVALVAALGAAPLGCATRGSVDGLETRVSSLEDRVETLERRMDAFDGRISTAERSADEAMRRAESAESSARDAARKAEAIFEKGVRK